MLHGNDPVYDRNGHDRYTTNISTALPRVAGFCTVAFWLASYLPTALIGVAMAQFLTLAAFASVTLALLLQQSPFASAVTRWDEAACLALVALLAKLTTDETAARAALESLGVAAGQIGGA